MGECVPISENCESNDVVSSELHDCYKYKYPIGLGFGVGNRVRALKNADDWNWWKFPMVDVANVKCEKSTVENKEEKKIGELELQRGLLLKLDYDGVLNDWAGKGLHVPEDVSRSMYPGGDIHVTAANIDLFSEDEDGGWKEYSATKKIRPIKNACSDKRPRCKGRFMKKPNSSVCDEVSN
ncbi:hypothetical protein M8C21_002513 [Ambrosia artemisiifolia]|uniref:Uncharacterized protein n=1 Tax=Ambrosia artemisiifolia TaxID=4212 RepID=A0AAD5CSH2_AMBAR|nr:hypothetical protein M8C21_002513 [Ambrosia artemisiifolia]